MISSSEWNELPGYNGSHQEEAQIGDNTQSTWTLIAFRCLHYFFQHTLPLVSCMNSSHWRLYLMTAAYSIFTSYQTTYWDSVFLLCANNNQVLKKMHAVICLDVPSRPKCYSCGSQPTSLKVQITVWKGCRTRICEIIGGIPLTRIRGPSLNSML